MRLFIGGNVVYDVMGRPGGFSGESPISKVEMGFSVIDVKLKLIVEVLDSLELGDEWDVLVGSSWLSVLFGRAIGLKRETGFIVEPLDQPRCSGVQCYSRSGAFDYDTFIAWDKPDFREILRGLLVATEEMGMTRLAVDGSPDGRLRRVR